ncbi:peptidoglycan DD-metalloendopeptidase family protein [Candidatus Azambacteria bacterium]|nr:peptidoglycan DD-metalloendopeptidase family protein [Candidatus Azambacteria bacterium]MBI3685650.1 peptidoglycan DD-metalloendopeptidase family protein [Candidatus Azambacteria bacterium]
MPKIFIILCAALVLAAVVFVLPGQLYASVIDDLKLQIEQRGKEIEALESQKAKYQQQLDATKQEGNTFRREVSRIEKEILDLNVTIKKTQTKINETDLRIEELKNQIGFKQDEIENTKSRLGYIMRTLDAQDNGSFLSLVFSVRNFSELFSQQEHLLSLQKEVHSGLADLRVFKSELESFKRSQETEKDKLDDLHDNLGNQRIIAGNQKNEKETLVLQTKSKEKEYQRLIADVNKKQGETEKEINVLEAKLRLAIDRSKLPVGTGILRWPLDEVHITQGYGKPNWKAAYDFHNGIDLGAPTGTIVRASLAGKITGVGNNGKYAYGKWIAIDHGDLNITTLYGHLSLQKVKVGQTVATGEVIGYVGSTGYSTGPHLHFSVFATESFTLLESKAVKGLMIPVGGTIDPGEYL